MATYPRRSLYVSSPGHSKKEFMPTGTPWPQTMHQELALRLKLPLPKALTGNGSSASVDRAVASGVTETCKGHGLTKNNYSACTTSPRKNIMIIVPSRHFRARCVGAGWYATCRFEFCCKGLDASTVEDPTTILSWTAKRFEIGGGSGV